MQKKKKRKNKPPPPHRSLNTFVSLCKPRMKYRTMKKNSDPSCLLWIFTWENDYLTNQTKGPLGFTDVTQQNDKQKKQAKRVSADQGEEPENQAKRASNSNPSWYDFNSWTRLWNLLESLFQQQVYPNLSLSWQHVCHHHYLATSFFIQDSADSHGAKPVWKEHERLKTSCHIFSHFHIISGV